MKEQPRARFAARGTSPLMRWIQSAAVYSSKLLVSGILVLTGKDEILGCSKFDSSAVQLDECYLLPGLLESASELCSGPEPLRSTSARLPLLSVSAPQEGLLVVLSLPGPCPAHSSKMCVDFRISRLSMIWTSPPRDGIWCQECSSLLTFRQEPLPVFALCSILWTRERLRQHNEFGRAQPLA